jgi:hypothetical protein
VEHRAWDNRSVAELDITVVLTEPEVAGSYRVGDMRDDGSLVLRPLTSAEDDPKAPYREIVERHREMFDRLPT